MNGFKMRKIMEQPQSAESILNVIIWSTAVLCFWNTFLAKGIESENKTISIICFSLIILRHCGEIKPAAFSNQKMILIYYKNFRCSITKTYTLTV